MTLRRTAAAFASGLAALLAISACGSEDSEGGEADKPTIGVVNLTAASEATNAAADAIKMGGEHLGWNIQVGDGQGDPAKITQIMQSFVNDDVDAIFTLSISAPMISPQLKAAKDADIPVIAAVYAEDPATADQFTAVYSPDYKKAGVALGQAALDAGVEPGKILVQNYPSFTIKNGFMEGALETLEGQGFKAVETEIDVKNLGPSLQSTARNLIQGNPDAQLFIGGLSGSAPTVFQVLDGQKRTDMTVLGAFDTADQLKLIRDGKPLILVVPDYARSAFIGLDQLRSYFEDGTDLDPKAGADDYTYKIVDKTNVPKDGPVFPLESIAQEYFDKWDAAK